MFSAHNNSFNMEFEPSEFFLSQNYPNPFKEKTTIKYCVPYKTWVQLIVYDNQGKLIEKLVDEVKEPGTYEVKFSALVYHSGESAAGGRNLPDGYYYYTLKAADYSSERKWFCINNKYGRFNMKSLIQLFIFLFIWVKVFAQSPIISVTPDSLSEELLSGKTSEQVLTIYNNGGSDLTFEINVKDNLEALLLNSTTNYSIISSTQPLEVTDLVVRENKNYNWNSSPLTESSLFEKNEKLFEENSLAGGLKILLITSGGYPSEIKDALLSFPDIQQVDIFDASGSTPTLNQVLPYQTIIAMDNTPYADPVAMGNVLADYVDAGRGLILTVATFASGWEIKGRLLNDGYFPFNLGYGPAGGASLGTFNPSHPIMQGVTSAYGDLLVDLTLADGAELVASWNTSWPFIATKGKNVAAVNIYVTEPGFWTGDIPTILHNAAFWVGSCRWLSAEPDTGTIPAGSSMNITMKFSAAGLIGGEYNSDIKITSNDPVTPELIVPAHLSVTDAPAIWVQTDNIDFGEVFLGVTDTFYLEVKNIGSQDLLIFSATIQPTEFAVSPAFAGIDPGENEIFTVTFNPTAVGTYPGTLTLSSNDPLYGTYIINLSGQGVEPPVIVVYPDSLVVGVLPGSTKTKILTISNEGESNLYFNIAGGYSSTRRALQFDGIDDYVRVPSVDLNYSQLTLEAWVILDDISDIREVIDNTDGDFQLEIWSPWWLDRAIMFEAVTTYSRLVTDPNVMPLNQWVHLAATYDGSLMSVYVDGNFIAQQNYSGSINRPNTIIHIGAETNGLEQFWDGIIDEVRIWNLARTQQEIQEFMHKPLTGTEQGLFSYWQFDEGDGNITYDRSVNGNHGTLMGGVEWTTNAASIEPGWFFTNTDSGVCLPHTSMDIELLFDATELDTGDYYASIIVYSNDPVTPTVVVPIHMIVSTSVGVGDELNTPLVFNLYQNYPNPFNPITTIKYSIPELSKVRLTLFNLLGEEVTTLVNEEKNTGNYTVDFNADNLPSGVYFYQLKAGNFVETKKMILIK